MPEVLDYSAGFPAPAAIRQAGYVGIVRYIGTPGRGKNLTRGEAQAMIAAKIPIALVYEDSAGWMLGGFDAGAAAARAALADAERCGVGVRCVYFADDQDTVTPAQFAAVNSCLDGAASVIRLPRTGIYGEADVIDSALSGRHATWGWGTRAWSGGRVSDLAHLEQLVGYVYPGGIQCDRSTVLKPDWGQWPAPPGAADIEEEDVSADDVWNKKIPYPEWAKDVPHSKPAYTAGEYLAGASASLGRLEAGQTADAKRDAAQTAQITALTAANTTLAQLLAAQHNLSVDDVQRAVTDAVVHVQVTVGQPAEPAPATAPAQGGQA